jgi:hypothetical protein
MKYCIALMIVAFVASSGLAGPTTAPATRPARILPQNQQALLYFGIYKISADQLAADGTITTELRQKLVDRITAGRADTDSMLASATPPGEGPAGIQQSAKLAQEVSQRTRACVRDIRQMLNGDQYKAFDGRGRITMEEVQSLQVIKADTDYVRRDLLGLLSLSVEQQRQVDALLKSNHQHMIQLMKQYTFRPGEGRGTYLSTEQAFETRAALRKILTVDQLKQWDQEILKRYGGKPG